MYNRCCWTKNKSKTAHCTVTFHQDTSKCASFFKVMLLGTLLFILQGNKSSVSYHILPVKHLQDVTEQLAASLRLLPHLQVELQLLRHQRQKDLTAICRDAPRKINTHTLDDRSHTAVTADGFDTAVTDAWSF